MGNKQTNKGAKVEPASTFNVYLYKVSPVLLFNVIRP